MRDTRKLRYGVAIHMNQSRAGMLRLTLDDVEAEAETPERWQERNLFTFIDIDEAEARSFSLGREVYAAIGDALVARLLALDGALGNRPESPRPRE